MKKIFLIIILLSSVLISCEDYTDITPRGISIPTNLKDVDLLLNNETQLSGSRTSLDNFPVLISDNLYIKKSEIDVFKASLFTLYTYNVYYLNKEIFPIQSDDHYWRNAYTLIGSCNYILRVIENVEGDKKLKAQYRAEALTHRAFVYFTLVNTYGHHYGHPQYDKPDTGVPIIKEFANTNESLKRASVKEVYKFMVDDLLEAEKNASDQLKNKGRINKNKVCAMLAKIYFHMGNLQDAEIMVNKALGEFNTLLDYDKINSLPFDIKNDEAVIYKEGSIPSNRSWSGMLRFSSDLLNLYDKDNDLRVAKFCDKSTDGDYIYQMVMPWTKTYNFGLSVPELMLIKAEILARTQRGGLAMDEINKLRAKRYTADAVAQNLHKLSASDDNEAIQNVINERRREFHTKGRRFFDIKRLNALYNGNISLTRGETTLKPNSLNWALPLSEKLIESSNGQIVQNKRD